MTDQDFAEAVIKLHEIARMLERAYGVDGALSKDIRNCADRLNELSKGVL
jgi:hypothetical protein